MECRQSVLTGKDINYETVRSHIVSAGLDSELFILWPVLCLG